MKYWEIVADNLHKAGWSLGWVSALDFEGRTEMQGVPVRKAFHEACFIGSSRA
jgi:hypothetical protein